MWQVLIQNWLRNRLYRELHTAAGRFAAEPSADDLQSRRCEAAFLFAVPQEAGGLVDRLSGLVTRHADGFTVHVGTLGGRSVAIARSGIGREAAARTARAVIAAHRPDLVVSAGFAGGLDERLHRGDVVIATDVVLESGERVSFDLKPDSASTSENNQVHFGRLLTVDRLISDPAVKRQLRESAGAIAVDMETFAVAQICQERQQPMLSVRVVSDAVGDRLPREVGRLLAQKSLPGKLGALAGAVMRRPSSVKDLYQLKEDALVASDRLADRLEQIVGQLPVSADDAAVDGE